MRNYTTNMENNKVVMYCVVVLLVISAICEAYKVKYKAQYFSNVTLECDEKIVRPPFSAFLKYWILPNNTVLQWSHRPDGKHSMSTRPVYSLTINNVDDDDYGWYKCVILWDNRIFLVDSIDIGLSADYGDTLENYKSRAIIGGISAGVMSVVLVLFCLTCSYLYGEADEDRQRIEERQAVYELDRTVRRFEEALAGNGEVALRMSRPESVASSSTERIDRDILLAKGPQLRVCTTPLRLVQEVPMEDGIYATVVKGTPVETASELSSGFYDNKAFEYDNDILAPFDEHNVDFASSVFRECGDQLL